MPDLLVQLSRATPVTAGRRTGLGGGSGRRRLDSPAPAVMLSTRESPMSTVKLAASLLVLLAVALGAVPALAETVNCTPITSLPAVISVPGIYCFTGNLDTSISSSGDRAITISANNVVLDLNGFKLGGLGGGTATLATGVFASGRQNITIKNGTIRGFWEGIFLFNSAASQGHVIEDIRADNNRNVGINVDGTGNIVRNNQVVATGGSTSGIFVPVN